jgi:hypothetical protein
MKEQLFNDSLESLLKSYALAKEDGSEQTDIARFKIQEIHTLTSFYNEFNSIEFSEKAKLNLPKTIKNENLVENNISAF